MVLSWYSYGTPVYSHVLPCTPVVAPMVTPMVETGGPMVLSRYSYSAPVYSHGAPTVTPMVTPMVRGSHGGSHGGDWGSQVLSRYSQGTPMVLPCLCGKPYQYLVLVIGLPVQGPGIHPVPLLVILCKRI